MVNEKRILARVAELAPYGVHPDAYIFTREAQKAENSPLEIVRVYRYHFRYDHRSYRADGPLDWKPCGCGMVC